MKYRNLLVLSPFLVMAFSGLVFAQPVLPNDYVQPNVGISVYSFSGSIHGFSLNGEAFNDQSGYSVASGDINGDGFKDVIIGARYAAVGDSSNAGKTYVFFGKASGFSIDFELSTLDGTNGFVLNGIGNDDFSGTSVASGDINGDGYDDVIIGAPNATPNGSQSGITFIYFGKASGFSSTFGLSNLDGLNGFSINGETTSYNLGQTIASGDFNGDGFEDILLGALAPRSSFVLFGQASGFISEFELTNLDGSNGFEFKGSGGYGVSFGDVNGDGFDDLITGHTFRNPNGISSGQTNVLFGAANGFSSEIQVSELDGTNGFILNGEQTEDRSGAPLSSIDVNGDGYDDVIVSAFIADISGDNRGRVYVFFGKSSGYQSEIELSDLNGTTGFKITGEEEGSFTGRAISSGDINGDGFGDIIIGSVQASEDYGIAYVVFGKSEEFETNLELSDLNGINGIKIYGEEEGSFFSGALSTGDINNDGHDDVIIGAYFADPNSVSSGKTYVFTNTSEQEITGSQGFRMLSNHAHGKVYNGVLGQFWTQGFTNSDAPAFGTNAWTWNHTTQSWQGFSDQKNDSLLGGGGYLFYMFDDDDNSVNTYESFPKTIVSPASFLSVDNYDVVPNIGWVYAFDDLADGDYFLFGNPYTFRLNWDKPAGWEKENLSNTFYIWSDSASQWLTWNGLTGNKPDSSTISPFQSVFVQASGGTGSLAVRENASGFTGGGIYKASSSQMIGNLKLELNNEEFSTEAFISFHSQGELEKDDFDGMLLTPLTDSYLQIGTANNEYDVFFSIQSLPNGIESELTFPLYLAGRNTNSATRISMKGIGTLPKGYEVIVFDRQTSERIKLKEGESIEVEAEIIKGKGKSDLNPSPIQEVQQKDKVQNRRYELIITNEVSNIGIEEPKITPEKFSLFQNYPNPFNPSTTIKYELPENSLVELSVFDMLGRKVATLVNGRVEAGYHDVNFDASQLASGIYISQLYVNGNVFTQKMTLIK